MHVCVHKSHWLIREYHFHVQLLVQNLPEWTKLALEPRGGFVLQNSHLAGTNSYLATCTIDSHHRHWKIQKYRKKLARTTRLLGKVYY